MAKFICALSILFFISTVSAASVPENQQEKVSVTVYYESLCPDSKKFIVSQLKPVYSNMSMYMNLTLVPFGKSTYNKTVDGKFVFACHHGDLECTGNKVQACAVKLLPMEQQFNYINCLMETVINSTNDSSVYPSSFCANLTNSNYNTIEGCIKGQEGDEYLAALGDKTDILEPKLQTVPTIVFNDKFMMEENQLAKTDFRKALCNKFMGTKPAECAIPDSKGFAFAVTPGYLPVMLVTLVTMFTRL